MTPYRWMAYAAVAAIALTAFGSYTAWIYHRGGQSVQREWDAAKATAVLEGHKDQVELGKLDQALQENLDANRDAAPVISIVPERLCEPASVPAAANHPGKPAATSRASTAAAIGAALKHDADRYPDCVAALDAAQAALRLIGQNQARTR